MCVKENYVLLHHNHRHIEAIIFISSIIVYNTKQIIIRRRRYEDFKHSQKS
jgi:hypothetical protein